MVTRMLTLLIRNAWQIAAAALFILLSLTLALAWKMDQRHEMKVLRLQADIDKLVASKVADASTEDLAKKVASLREYVYTRTTLGAGDFNYSQPIDHFISFHRNGAAMACGGMAATYSWLLQRHGIASRTVKLATRDYVEGRDRLDTHVSVEVADPHTGALFVSDPTFNVAFLCQDAPNLLDFRGMRACLDRGSKVIPVADGTRYFEERRIENYPVPIEDLVYAVHADEVAHADPDESLHFPELRLPTADWYEQTEELYQSDDSVR